MILSQKFWFTSLPRCNCTIRNICATPDSLAHVLYNIPTVYFVTYSACLPSPFLLSQLQQPTPSSPRPQTLADHLFQRVAAQAIFARSKLVFDCDGDHRPCPRGMSPSSPFFEYRPPPHIFFLLEFILSDF